MTGQEIVNFDKAWAEQAQVYAAQEKLVGGTFISARGGQLTIGEEVLPGNQMAVVVLDMVNENTLYQGKFDPDNRMPPICYAFGRSAEEMAPHATMQTDLTYFKPQSADCPACPNNAWGSADQGRGKACQNRRRLALIPAGYYQPRRGSRDMDLELFSDPKHFQSADIAYAKLPVTSVTPWSKYVNQVAANFQRPPHGVVTRVWLEPDAKTQFKWCFEVIEEVPDVLAAAIMARHDQAVRQVIQGYQVPQEQPAVANGSLRGLRAGGFNQRR